MLRLHHIRCGVVATLLLAVCCNTVAQTASAPVIDNGQLQAAFAKLRQWVSDFESPKIEDELSRANLASASGVCVILRRAGRVMGVGSDASGDDLMLRRAAGKAMNEILADPALASLSARLRKEQQENPEAAIALESILADLGQSLAIELEVAGKLSPLIGLNIDQLARKIEPGLDGIGLRHNQTLELAFPAHMRALNTGGEPAKLLLGIALKSGLSLKDVGDLPKRDEVGLYTFRTATLWQSASNQPPIATVRGDVLVTQDSVNKQSIAQFADGIAQHLIASMWPDPPPPPRDPNAAGPQPLDASMSREPLGIMGDYSPTADQYRPLLAPPLEQALAAFALHRYISAAEHGADAAIVARSIMSATTILRDVANVTPAEVAPQDDLAACAVIVYAVCEQPGVRNDPSIELLLRDAIKRVNESFDPASGFVDRTSEGKSRGVASHTQAMIAGAMCRALNMDNPPVTIEPQRVRAALDASWQSVPEPQHIALLPWIGWGEADFAEATKQPEARANDLRLMLDLLNEVRVKPAAAGDIGQSQLAGGFLLLTETGGLGTATPQATAQTSRPAAWVASALANPEIVPSTQAAVRGHLETVRFLMQLSVRQEITPMFRNPVRAAGGIRTALWDNDQPVPAQALALITAADSLKIRTEQPSDR